MVQHAAEDARAPSTDGRVFVKVLLVFFFLLEVFFVFFLEFIGNRVEGYWVGLRHLQFRFAFWAAEDLSFLNLVFVHIYFRGAFWAAQHFRPPFGLWVGQP